MDTGCSSGLSAGGLARKGIALLIAVSLISACATRPPSQPPLPQWALHDVELVESGMLTQRWHFRLALTNPHPQALPLRSLVYDILLHGQPVATGQRIEAVRLAPGETRVLVIPVSTHLGASLQRLRQANHQPGDPVPWTLRGQVTLMQDGKPRQLERHGRLRLPVVP